MDLPRKHHANPRFYLSRWVGSDMQLCAMRLINGKVTRKRFHPQNTGWVKDLYRTNGVAEAESQNLETKFMAPLDAKASRALYKFVHKRALDKDERKAWVQFLLSLLYRNREAVELIKGHMANLWNEAIVTLEGDWALRRMPEETRTMAEAYADRQRGSAELSAARIMQDIIGGHRAEPDIISMRWTHVDLSRSTIPLLTSDRPVVFGALSNPDTYIALPLGPHDLFIAAFDDRFENQIPVSDPNRVAWLMNKDVVSQAREYVWGIDDAEIDFVRTYIGSVPDRVILSKQQQEESIAAARGLKQAG